MEAWRDGRTIHLRVERGDTLAVHQPDLYTNLAQMTRERPDLPESIHEAVQARVDAAFDPLMSHVDADPDRAIEEAWAPLRSIAVDTYRHRVSAGPPSEVVDMVTVLARHGHVDDGWVDVAYPLYYWATHEKLRASETNPAAARSYLLLGKALATALLIALTNSD